MPSSTSPENLDPDQTKMASGVPGTRKVSPRKAARLRAVHGSLPDGICVKTKAEIRHEEVVRREKLRRKALHHAYMVNTRQMAAGYYVELNASRKPVIACVELDDDGFPIRKPRPSGWWYHQLLGHVLSTDVVCRFCMVEPITTLDHVWPVDLGGCSHLHNLVGACLTCNQLKSNMHPRAVGMTLHLPTRFFDPDSNIIPETDT